MEVGGRAGCMEKDAAVIHGHMASDVFQNFLHIQLLECPIPAAAASQKASH